MPFMAMMLTPHDTWKYLSTIVKINVHIWHRFSSSIQFNRYGKIVFGIFIDLAIFAKLFLANNFYLYGLLKIFPVLGVACYCK